MRAIIYLVGVFLMFSTQVVSVGCGDALAPVICDEDSCRCMDREYCDLDCVDIVGCQPSCSAVGDGCGDNCTIACSAAGICRAETGANSSYTCINAGDCAVELGDDSVATCTSVDSCSVRCMGTCTVICIDADTCSVECLEGERTNCGQGLFTCGIECP